MTLHGALVEVDDKGGYAIKELIICMALTTFLLSGCSLNYQSTASTPTSSSLPKPPTQAVGTPATPTRALVTPIGEREAIIAFTRQAVAIEGQHDALVRRAGSIVLNDLFVAGEGTVLPGASELRRRLLLLECPASVSHIKESLFEAYELEIQAANDSDPLKDNLYYPSVNRFNVDIALKQWPSSYRSSSPWIAAQQLRRDVYVKWAQLLRVHGIDPVSEGLAAAPTNFPRP